MTKRLKPFRLINKLECAKLEHDFRNNLEAWNQQFALFPLSLQLDCNPNPEAFTSGSILVIEHQTIALLPTQNLSILSHCLFGEVSDCFEHTGENMFGELLKQLFGPLQQHSIVNQNILDEWFYTGSPALGMTLRCATYRLDMYLHPQWVLNVLPQHTLLPKPKASLQEVLGSQLLDCQVELHPLTLQLDKLLRLKPGDVIKTDHALSTPVTLKHQQQTVCHANIGETRQSKSIQIVSLL